MNDESASNMDFEVNFENESSYVYLQSKGSSSEEEIFDSESSNSLSENIPSVWMHVYPPEPSVDDAFKFTEPGVKKICLHHNHHPLFIFTCF